MTTTPTAPAATPETEAADRMAKVAVAVTGVRCALMYLVLPALGPVVSQYGGVIAPISALLHVVTLVTTTMAVRRAWRSSHPWRVPYAMLGACFFLWSAGELALFDIPYLLSRLS